MKSFRVETTVILSLSVTCEKGSSSELGKSYWLRSLGLNTEGPECCGADRGGILGFFSYFLLGRAASVFSGCGEKEALSVYTAGPRCRATLLLVAV